MSNLKVVSKGSDHIVDNNESHSRQGVGLEEKIYTSRFSPAEEEVRQRTWDVLVDRFLTRYMKPSDCIVDLGAGDGLFISRVTARKRIAVDLSPHVKKLESQGIEVHVIPATQMATTISEPADVVFMSNFLEHMPDKSTLLNVLRECRKSLKPGGKVIILQPNVRYAGAEYWDYIDHHIALTEFSLKEALEICGFTVEELIPRFLPYTAKSGVGKISALLPTKLLVSVYLKVPLLWRLFGAQTFVVARA